MKYKLRFNFLPNEVWYGANINDGWKLPITEKSKMQTDTRYISSYNQASTLWLSNKGRYVWSESGYLVKWNKGKAMCFSKKSEIKLYAGFENLRGPILLPAKLIFRLTESCQIKQCFVHLNIVHGYILQQIRTRRI